MTRIIDLTSKYGITRYSDSLHTCQFCDKKFVKALDSCLSGISPELLRQGRVEIASDRVIVTADGTVHSFEINRSLNK